MADEGFLSRWSRRKQQARGGVVVGDEVVQPPPQPSPSGELPPAQPSPSGGAGDSLPPPLGEGRGGGTHGPLANAAPTTPPPTLDDVQCLTPESDFSRFVRANVTPDVKNAAVRKLFADPRFNVMDGLDVYVDDYSRPDPLPESMLRQLASAKFMGLFAQEDVPRDDADEGPPANVAQSEAAPPVLPAPAPGASGDAHPDLRLQQDDAPGGRAPGHEPE